MKAKPIRHNRRQAGIALLVVTVTIAVIGATVGDFAYNTQVDLEAASNSRDMLRAEYLARSSIQLGQLIIAVQTMLYKQMQQLPPEFRDMFVLTEYAGFLAQAFGSDKEARDGLGGLVGLDLSNAKGLGTPGGTSFDLKISSEEGKFFINCGGGVSPDPTARLNIYKLLYALIKPLRYDRMFNVPDADGIVISREDLPAAIIDWTDVDLQRYVPTGNASAPEERYDHSKDRYEAHNQYLDTIEELNLVRGVGEDFWAAFGEMFTVYGSTDCRVLANAVPAESWPLIAAMITASSPDPSVPLDPNTVQVAQQVAGILKTGLPVLKQLATNLKIPPCDVDAKSCATTPTTTTSSTTTTTTSTTTATTTPATPAAGGDSISLLSNLICSQMISELPTLAQGLTSMLGADAPPKTQVQLRPIKMCPGQLAQYLRDTTSSKGNPRRYYRIDAVGMVQRNAAKATQVHIRGVWDSQSFNSTPLCTNHPSCTRGGTWVYFRMD